MLLVGGVVICNQQLYDIPQEEQLVNAILETTADSVERKYDLRSCGMGAAMPEGIIKGLTLCFDTKKINSQEQLRKLLLNSANDLLENVKKNHEIERYLEQTPFTIKNVSIIIYNYDISDVSLKDPNIAVARITDGKLIYRTIDPSDSFKFKNKFEESYEEALKKS